MKRALVLLLLLLARTAHAQNPVSISQLGTATQVTTTLPVSGSVSAVESGSWLVQGMVASAGANSGNPMKTGGVFNTTQPTVTNGQIVDFQASARGAQIVAVGVDGFAVTANAGTNLNTSALATSANQTNATQKTQIVDGSGNVIASTTNNLNVQCANCSGSGASAVDNATVTESTSVFAPIGGEFLTTPGTVTTGHQAMAAITAHRALQVSLFDTAGNAITPSADATTNTASQTTGPQTFCNASTATPTAVGADGRSIAEWCDTVGRRRVDLSTIQGTAADVNSGTKSAGTLRVVLATDQPQLTNKLLVTPDSVALPANQSVNVNQINGVTPLMGAGATGTGAQRTNGVSEAVTGAAPPAAATYVGGLGAGATGGFLLGIPVCDSVKAVSMTSATTTLMVTGVSGRHVRICSVSLVTAIANNVAFLSGTGATCGTGTAGMAGGTTAANGYNFAANGGLALGSGIGTVMQTVATGDSVCLITSAAGPLAGTIAYTIY